MNLGDYANGYPNYFNSNMQGIGQNAVNTIPQGIMAQNPEYVAQMNAGRYTPTSTEGTGMMGNIGNIGQAAQGLGALANAYTAYKGLNLAQDQFGFEKAAANRNVATQGKQINTAYDNANAVGMSLAGNTMTDADRAASIANTKAKYVDTSALG